MSLWLVILLFVLGLVLIVKGGDEFVDAAGWMAEASGIPRFLIGATVVSFATTLPELLVSLMAVINGQVDMAVGNAVGSVTANTGLILGVALLFMPMGIKRMQYFPKAILMLSAAGIIVAAGLGGGVGVVTGILLLVLFIVAMGENIHVGRLSMLAVDAEDENAEVKAKPTGRVVAINVAKFVLGAAAIVVGAQLLVDNGAELARLVGVPERIIGVTVIAVGTSLPELVTTITAIAKKQASLSVGNIIGANIIDLTLILPLCALATGKTLPISADSGMIDLPACLLVGLVAVVPTLITGKFTRAQGVVLLVLYGIYVAITSGLLAF